MEKIQTLTDKFLEFSSDSGNTSSMPEGRDLEGISQIMSKYQAFLDNLSLHQKYASNGLDDWSPSLLDKVIEMLSPILEPVSVNYSNELLATQIYGLSILLFVLSVLIIVLLLAFMLNIVLLVYSDKLLSFFTNKYIRWYIQFNKKMIGVELSFLGLSILYFMYMLSYGIHFIATHPISIK